MLRTIAILALLIAGAAKPSWAQPKAAKAPGPVASLPKPTTWTMENGLQVAFLPMPKAPSVTVQLWYHVGAKNEARDRRGSAHMFEHMMFKGTENLRAEEHVRHLAGLGGYVNAFTTEDVTAYHNTLPAEHMDFAIQLEAERMRNLWFRDDMIATEKEVVKEEIRQQENNPIFTGFLRFLEIAYRTHPYAWTAGGDLKDLDATTKEDLKSFYDRYYVPNNALLVVVGNVEEAAVRASVDKWFAKIPKGDEPPRLSKEVFEKPQTEARREVVDPAQIGVIMRGYHIPEAKHPDMHALRVLALILSGGESSRLYEQIVRKKKVAVQVGGQLVVREHPGLFMVFGAFLDPAKGKDVEDALAAEVSQLQKGAVSRAELSKAKKQLQAQMVYGMDNVTGIANQIGNSWIQRGDAGSFLEDLHALESVTAADVKRVATQYLGDSQSNVVVIPPASAGPGGN